MDYETEERVAIMMDSKITEHEAQRLAARDRIEWLRLVKEYQQPSLFEIKEGEAK